MPVTLSIQVKGAEIKRRGLQNLRREIPIIAAQHIYEILVKVKRKLGIGRRIRYPIQWDSERQRRAFFASNGFGGGIPYHRTGGYGRAWQIRRNPGVRVMAGYSMVNALESAQYIGGNAYGQRQSNIHRGRWPIVRDEVELAVQQLPRLIEDHITMVARREGLK